MENTQAIHKQYTSNASISGGLAGATEALINCPFETIKVQMQAKENLGRINTTGQCIQHIVKTKGASYLYNGLQAQMLRNVIWNSLYFGIIDYFPVKKGASMGHLRVLVEL